MSDPLQTAQAIEPDPIPSNLHSSAPIKGDLERGYVNDQGIYAGDQLHEDDDSRRTLASDGEGEKERGRGRASQLRQEDEGNSRRASPSAGAGTRSGSRAGLGKKEEKAHGSGLTEGDEGQWRGSGILGSALSECNKSDLSA